MEAPDQSLDLAMDEAYTLTVDAPTSLLKVRWGQCKFECRPPHHGATSTRRTS